MNQKLKTSQIIYVSFMLFSIFFGAGNMIFPPALGQQAGTQAPWALLGFIITDAGLAVLGILAVVMAGSSMDSLVGKAGRKVGILLTAIIYLLLGPFFALPRTGAVSFEIGVVPFLPEGSSHFVPMLLYTAIFFGITYFFSLKPAKVVDVVGKFMTPVLLLSIGVIFVAAVFNPLGPVQDTAIVYENGPFIEGLLQGYLALDGFAALVFAIIVIDVFRDKGVTDHKQVVQYTAKVGIVAVVLLCLVYGALCFVGSQTSGMEAFANGGVLLNYAVYSLWKMGKCHLRHRHDSGVYDHLHRSDDRVWRLFYQAVPQTFLPHSRHRCHPVYLVCFQCGTGYPAGYRPAAAGGAVSTGDCAGAALLL